MIYIYLLIPPKLLLQFITLMVRAIILVSFCLPSTFRLCYVYQVSYWQTDLYTRYWQTVYQILSDSVLSTRYLQTVYQVLPDSPLGTGRQSTT